MKTFLLTITCCILGGCGTYGEPLFLAAIYDNNDPCQRQNWVNGQQPRYCGAGSSRTYIYTTPHQAPIGTQSGYLK